jgi:hypothetical protein
MSDDTQTATAPGGGQAPEQSDGFASDLQRIEARDARDLQSAALDLADWGDSGEWAANVRLINRRVDRLPLEQREQFNGGTTKDGTALGNDPTTLRAVAANARKSPPPLIEAAKAHDGDEHAALQEMMRDRNGEYWRGKFNEELQARGRDLIREQQLIAKTLQSSFTQEQVDEAIARLRPEMDKPEFPKRFAAALVAQGHSHTEAYAVVRYFRARLMA